MKHYSTNILMYLCIEQRYIKYACLVVGDLIPFSQMPIINNRKLLSQKVLPPGQVRSTWSGFRFDLKSDSTWPDFDLNGIDLKPDNYASGQPDINLKPESIKQVRSTRSGFRLTWKFAPNFQFNLKPDLTWTELIKTFRFQVNFRLTWIGSGQVRFLL